MSGHRILGTGVSGMSTANRRLWQIAVLTAAGSLGATAQADAALFNWQDSDPGYYRPAPGAPSRKPRARKPSSGKNETAEKETGAKPQGPLVINVSIEKQRVRVYDTNGLFAESPVSTGMKGHATPMGVFSIIQKHKMHHSNIYSGAPMPFMQRITWSGVAMHAGVLPGYPASHGCIRMPMAFATKMWNWTKMGARVIVTPGEITPANFSHPLLIAQKVVPQPVIADEPKTDAPAIKGDKGADAGSSIKAIKAEASLELRSTVGHASPQPTRTADASSSMPANAPVTMSDATPSAASADAKPEAPKSEPVKPEADAAPAKSTDTAASDSKPAEAAAADVKSVETVAAEKDGDKVDEAAKTELSASSVKAEDKPTEAKSDEAKTESAKTESEPNKTEPVKAEAPKADEPKAVETKPVEKPAEPAKAVADTPAVAPDVKKDVTRLPGVAKADLPKPTGQIAVFVSRKDSKLYVRANFKPLFDVPVTIAPSDRMLGTHVFTAEADKADSNLLSWSVVSLPVTARNATRNDDDDRSSKRRKMAGAAPVDVKPMPAVNSPSEALDRITVPQEAMARIAEALTTGGSIVVSDQGINQGETGEGTDFIVSLR